MPDAIAKADNSEFYKGEACELCGGKSHVLLCQYSCGVNMNEYTGHWHTCTEFWHHIDVEKTPHKCHCGFEWENKTK